MPTASQEPISSVNDSPPNLEFTKINSFISIYTPPPGSTNPTPSSTAISRTNKTNTDPTTIILCQWMGASPRSRALHAAYHQHHKLFPSARIITIRSTPAWFMTTSTATRLKLLSPALDAVEADPAGEKKRLLVHAFSNGGGLTYLDLCTIYKIKFGAGKKLLPVKALILDSSPGNPTMKEGWAAMKVGLPRGILWYPAAAVIWFYILINMFFKHVLGLKNIIDRMREGLLRWDVVEKSARRLYVYGTEDQIVGFRGIEREAERARREGVDVSRLRVEGGVHVQHMIRESERYWKGVEGLWDGTRE